MNITNAFLTVWNAFLSVVTWLQSNGFTLTIGESSYTVTWFTVSLAVAVIGIVCNLIPILGGDDE